MPIKVNSELMDKPWSHETRFWSELNDSLTEETHERNLFATLAAMYGEEEFTTGKISGNFTDTDQRFWGTFGSLVSKGLYTEENGRYRLTGKGRATAEAVDTRETLQMSATPEGYKTSGFRAQAYVALQPGQEPEELGYSPEGLIEYEQQ